MNGDGQREVELGAAFAAHPNHRESLAVDGVEADAVVPGVGHGHGVPVRAQRDVLRLAQLGLSVVPPLGICQRSFLIFF